MRIRDEFIFSKLNEQEEKIERRIKELLSCKDKRQRLPLYALTKIFFSLINIEKSLEKHKKEITPIIKNLIRNNFKITVDEFQKLKCINFITHTDDFLKNVNN
jgi:hypothetical protein